LKYCAKIVTLDANEGLELNLARRFFMSKSSIIAASLLGLALCAAGVANADDAKPTAPPQAKPAAPDPHCLHDTGTRLPVKPGTCSGVGRSYGADDVSRTGATTAGGALGLLDPSVTVR
jgi:hypothetical protein